MYVYPLAVFIVNIEFAFLVECSFEMAFLAHASLDNPNGSVENTLNCIYTVSMIVWMVTLVSLIDFTFQLKSAEVLLLRITVFCTVA